MVDIAQLVEHLIVVQEVACSSHVVHPFGEPGPSGPGSFIAFPGGMQGEGLSSVVGPLVAILA